MSIRQRLLSGTMLVGVSQLVTMGLSFGRNVIIARTISLADMGIASTIALALAVLDTASDVSVNQLIIQAKDGDDPRLQANAHSFMAARGVITAVVLLLLGGPLAQLFNIPDATWAFQLMAIAPLIRGFAHQDLWRYHRQMKFGPLVTAEIVSQVVALAVAWPLALWVGDYSVMLWVILIQLCIVTGWSHVKYERAYRLELDWAIAQRIVSFGWPLLINGVLILLLNYGDRAMIAIFPGYQMTDVGLYLVATTVVLMPTMLVSKLASIILLPALAKHQSDPQQFEKQLQMITVVVGSVAAAQAILLIIAGPSLTALCFGEKYLPVVGFFAWLSAASAIRVVRLSPTIGALAIGDSRNPLIASIARCSGFVIAFIAAAQHAGLHWFAIASFLGELISYVVSVACLKAKVPIRLAPTVMMTGIVLATIAISMGVSETIRAPGIAWLIPSAVALGSVTVLALIVASCFESIRVELRRLRSGLCGDRS